MGPKVPIIQANIQEHMVLKFQQETRGMMTNEQISVAQAAQQVASTNQELQDLRAKGPDEARNKLADAELARVMNESKRLEVDTMNKQVDNFFKSMKLELDKYKTDTQLLISQMQTESQNQREQLKELMDVLKESSKIQAAAENLKAVDKETKE